MTSPTLARQLLQARDLADMSYADPLTVADLARAAGLSPSPRSWSSTRPGGAGSSG